MACVLGSGAKRISWRSFAQNLLSMTVLSAGAETTLFATPYALAQVSERAFSLNVGQTTIAEALRILQNTTGANFIFSPDQLRALRTKGLSGQFTLAEALQRILEGSGFEAQATGKGTYVIADMRAEPNSAAARNSAVVPPLPPLMPAVVRPNQPDDLIPEIIVTAERRVENLQRVPMSLQVLTTDVIEQRQIVSFDDYAKLLPSVSFKTLGPGRSDIFFRGISTGAGLLLPTSGMYLDEIPVTTSGRSLDIHLYDIARIEALSGPQGTLFGASSLSGTLRVIINKPDPSRFSSSADVELNKYGAGNSGAMFEGFANIPLGNADAVRLVAFYQKAGGYVDNKPATITYQLGDADPNTKVVINNNATTGNNFNPVETFGGRMAAAFDLENWTISPQIIYQSQDARGDFLFSPKLGDLIIHDFSQAWNRDKWLLSSATIEGQLGNLALIYSGSYLSRQISNDNDYTYYTVAYDTIPDYTKFPDGRGGFIDPTQRYHTTQRLHKMSQELRASSPKTAKWRLSGGLFYQRQDTYNDSDYYINDFSKVAGIYAHTPSPVYADDIYLIYTHAKLLDYAAFVEGSYNIAEDVTLTAGTRLFGSESDQVGFNGTTRTARRVGCASPLATPTSCISRDGRQKGTGETHKINAQWQVDADRMVYLTYSTGYRPGGAQYVLGVKPYNADTLDNYELGYKTTWSKNLRLNGAFYVERWNGLQYRLAVPGNNGSVATYNAGQARVYGAEMDVHWQIAKGFTLLGSAAFNDARLTKDLCNLDSTLNPFQTCSPGANMAAPKGTRLPSQPRLKFSATARYETPVGSWNGFIQGGLQYQGGTHSYLSTLENSLFGNTAGFATVDLSIGGRHGSTSAEVFLQNALDNRGILSRDSFCAIQICSGSARSYPIKPRFFGLRIGRRY